MGKINDFIMGKEEKDTSIKMREAGIGEKTKELARVLFTNLMSLEDVDTLQEVAALMDDSIDLAIEFEMKLNDKRISVVDETEVLW